MVQEILLTIRQGQLGLKPWISKLSSKRQIKRVVLRDVALKTYLKQCTIEKGGGRGSGKTMLVAQHDVIYLGSLMEWWLFSEEMDTGTRVQTWIRLFAFYIAKRYCIKLFFLQGQTRLFNLGMAVGLEGKLFCIKLFFLQGQTRLFNLGMAVGLEGKLSIQTSLTPLKKLTLWYILLMQWGL